jgi:hypothetical protein
MPWVAISPPVDRVSHEWTNESLFLQCIADLKRLLLADIKSPALFLKNISNKLLVKTEERIFVIHF